MIKNTISYGLVICLFFLFNLYTCTAQQLTLWGPYEHGIDGLTTGSTIDSTYSALVINGPNRPDFENNPRDIIFKFRAAGISGIRALRSGSWGTSLQFLTTENESFNPIIRMHINEYGQVGIGTTNPTHTLTVNGTIRTKEVLVDVNAGADKVFTPEYQLKDLSEVKSYVNEHKHLPDIPSEKEMKSNGLNMNEFQIKLLQKIEELTLYIINQNEEIENLKVKLIELEKQSYSSN